MIIAGHAGPFRPNQSSQPACPFPTESYQPSSNCTNNNIRPPPLQQRPYLSSGSLPAPEAGAKQPKPQSSTSPALVSVTASRPSRTNKEILFHHPPTCTTPAVAADPPSSIQIMPVSTNATSGGDAHQARQQLESAKTFTEQYSLPDDITITPILPPNPPQQLNPALLMLNSSVSVMLTSAPSTTTTTTLTTNTSKSICVTHDGLLKSKNSFNLMPSKPKEKDIVHVIDPRSGQRTTIAKHISNNSRIAGSLSDISKNRTKIGKDSTNFCGLVGKGPGIIQQKTNSRMETVRKLNPDLDVIVINNSDGGMHGNRNDKTENIQTMNNLSSTSSLATNIPEKVPNSATGNHQGNLLKPMPPLKAGGLMAPNKTHSIPFSTITSSVMGIAPHSSHQHKQGKRVALAHSGNNNFHRNNSGSNNNTNNGGNSILRVSQKKSKAQKNSLSNTTHYPQQSVYPQLVRSPPSSTTSVSSKLPQSHNHNQYTIPSLPPGISICTGSSSGVGGPVDITQPTNLSKKNYGNVMTGYRQRQQQAPVNMTYQQPIHKNVKAIKRSLNECIDGLQLQHQQKKLKLLEQQHAVISTGNSKSYKGNGSPLSASTSARTGIFNVNGGKPIFSGTVSPQQQQILFQQQQQQFMQHQQQFVAGNSSNKSVRQQQQFLQTPMYSVETATAARVRGPDFEQKVGGGMVINSNDAMTAVSALVVEPFDYSLAGRQQAYNAIIHNNGLANRGRKEKAVGGRHIIASSYQAFTVAKKKINKLKGRQHVGEKVTLGGARGGTSSAGGSKSKIRTRLSVKPKGLHHNTQQPLGSRSRSRLLRKRSLLCNPNTSNNSGNRKSESDGGSVCASRSSSSVRIISGGAAQQNGGKGGKERERERPKHTQAFINATADLYQYRRRLILRVPSPKPAEVNSRSASSTATAVSNLNRVIPMGADAIARFGESSSSSPPIELASITKSEIPRELAAHQMHQIAFSQIVGNHHQSPMSFAVQESKGPSLSPLPRTGSMVVNALKKRAGMKPLSPASVNGALTQQLLLNSKRQPRWSNGWTFEGDPYEAKVYVKVRLSRQLQSCSVCSVGSSNLDFL